MGDAESTSLQRLPVTRSETARLTVFREGRVRLTRRGLAVTAGVAGCFLLAGCADRPPDELQRWRQKLALGTVGKVAAEDEHGGEPIGEAPTLFMFVEGLRSEVQRPVLQALANLHFEPGVTAGFWESRSEGTYKSLSILNYSPGESRYFPALKKRVVARGETTFFWLTVAAR